MLGKKIGTVTGTCTNSLEPAVGASPRFSTIGEGSGSLVGIGVQCMVKFRSEMNIDGSLFGEGQASAASPISRLRLPLYQI
jgi:hypothetical protein